MKEKLSEPWKPTLVQNDSFISKNKKRKEKRLAKNLTAQKAKTDEFIPVKKNALGPLNKVKNRSFQNGAGLSPKGKKENAFLSTSLPIKGNKKSKVNMLNNSIAALKPAKAAPKVPGILSNPNTPKKNKGDRVTFEDEKAKSKKLKQKSKSMLYESDDESDVSSANSVTDFLDNEASEGEEVEEGFYGEESADDSDSEDDASDSNDFLKDDDDSGEGTDEEVDSEESDDTESADDEEDEGDESDDEDEEPQVKPTTPSKNVKPNLIEKQDKKQKAAAETPIKGKQQTPVKEAKQNTPAKSKQEKAAEAKANTPAKTKPEKAVESKQNKKLEQKETPEKGEQKTATVTEDVKSGKQKAEKKNAPKQEKAAEIKQKKLEQSATAESKKENVKPEKKKQEKKEISRPSDYVGFIRDLNPKLTSEQIKTVLTEKVDGKNILQVTLTKSSKHRSLHNVFVYVKDEESLDNLLNHKFKFEKLSFVVYKAKSSAKETGKPVAFLPRVPTWITSETLKNSIEAEIGADKLLKIKDKKVSEKLQARNVLIYLSDLETLKNVIYKGAFKVDKETVIVREAVEAGLTIPVYRAVFADIPKDLTEPVLKKAIESTIGKNTVHSIRFSFRKKSFAFVTFKTAEAQQKALTTGNNISIKGSNLRVLEFIQRIPKKRAALSDDAKAKKAEKKKRKLDDSENVQEQQPSPKKPKQEDGSSAETNQSPKKKKRRRKPKKPASPATVTGEVKATKNPQKAEKQKGAPKKNDAAEPNKVTLLKKKIAEKQDTLKNKIKKKKNKKVE